MNTSRNIYDFQTIQALVDTDRELTDDERKYLEEWTNGAWLSLGPIAKGVLAERERLRNLWLEVERATGDDYIDRMEAFRRALGIT